MAITQTQFDVLVEKLETFSKSHPQSYRLRVALFAVLGYAYIFLILAALLGLVGLVVLFIIFSQHISGAVIKLGIVLLIPAWVIARSLWVTIPSPQGLRLSRHQAPDLFALVDELTTALQAPQFHKILLNQQFNAAVVQIPRLGIFGWQENYLLLGLPLMQSLTSRGDNPVKNLS
ncbi:Zn-dependent protease with chaperone function-like protein [Planktothrix tepida]|uniref:Zn-dependent protease with chaperone function-like protein n=1 Tax=Planktothrix tepida PCC 9214 TaxID=671072 RepID=A0A1J1LL41_9CYAN